MNGPWTGSPAVWVDAPAVWGQLGDGVPSVDATTTAASVRLAVRPATAAAVAAGACTAAVVVAATGPASAGNVAEVLAARAGLAIHGHSATALPVADAAVDRAVLTAATAAILATGDVVASCNPVGLAAAVLAGLALPQVGPQAAAARLTAAVLPGLGVASVAPALLAQALRLDLGAVSVVIEQPQPGAVEAYCNAARAVLGVPGGVALPVAGLDVAGGRLLARPLAVATVAASSPQCGPAWLVANLGHAAGLARIVGQAGAPGLVLRPLAGESVAAAQAWTVAGRLLLRALALAPYARRRPVWFDAPLVLALDYDAPLRLGLDFCAPVTLALGFDAPVTLALEFSTSITCEIWRDAPIDVENLT